MPHPGSRCTNHCEGEPSPTTERPNCGEPTKRSPAAATLEHKPRMQTSRYPPESVNITTIALRQPSRRSRAPRTAPETGSTDEDQTNRDNLPHHGDQPNEPLAPPAMETNSAAPRRPPTPEDRHPDIRHPDNQHHGATTNASISSRSHAQSQREGTRRNNQQPKNRSKKESPARRTWRGS